MANKKKISLIVASSLLLVAVVGSIAVVTVNHTKPASSPGGDGKASAASTSAIKAICEPALYKESCLKELTNAAGNNTDVKSLVKTAFQASIDRIRDAANRSSVLAAASKDPATSLPLETCKKLFESAVQELEAAIDSTHGYDLSNLGQASYELKNWLSAAHTYQVNCLDEFTNQTSDAALSMKQALNRSMELTANSIQIVHQIGSMASDFSLSSLIGKSRRLLEADADVDADVEGFPTWLSERRRRLLQLAPLQMKPLVTVAKDGSGQFTTIKDGIAAMPRKNTEFVVLYVKEGVYEEIVTCENELNKLVIVGDGPTKTRITGGLNVAKGGGIGTVETSTFSVTGEDFMARDIGFENSAGPEGHQAVAFRSKSERSVVLNCHFDGYQDTLYTQSKRQFYRDCTISGTIDFIFGNAYAVFQNCIIVARKPLPNQQNIVTAHGSSVPNEGTMYVLHNCTFVAEPALAPVIAQNPTYLGRPWKPLAKTVVLQSQLDAVIHPDGWLSWVTEPDSVNTCYYAEVDNRGPGADKARRVAWPGVKNLDLLAADMYTLDGLFLGADWVKTSGSPFFAGMLPSAAL